MSKEKVEQTEQLTKNGNDYLLTVNNYGGKKGQQLIQPFTKEELKEQYAAMKKQHHDNAQVMAQVKKLKTKYTGEEREKLEEFARMANQLKEFNVFIQQEAQADNLVEQNKAIRRGLKDIEHVLPELTR